MDGAGRRRAGERCRVVTFSLCDEPTSGFACDPERGIDNYLDADRRGVRPRGLSDAVVIGVSYSGPIAAEFAARHPGRVRGLVLVSALPLDWQPDRRARFYLRAPRLLSPLFLHCLAAPDGAGIEARASGAGTAVALQRRQRAPRRRVRSCRRRGWRDACAGSTATSSPTRAASPHRRWSSRARMASTASCRPS